MAIYHIGQELLRPLHDGKKIKQICHMGKMYLSEWLLSTTKAAIKLAFGSEAGQVISSTNTYLNTIASTNKPRAQQLADFINEDPMMVFSLQLQVPGVTIPIRWLVGDDTAYINTGLVNIDKDYTAKVQYHKYICLGCRIDDKWDTNRSYTFFGTNSFRGDWFVGNTNKYYQCVESSIYDVEVRKGLLKVNGSVVYSGSVTSDVCPNYPFYIMALNNFGTAVHMSSASHLSKCIIDYKGEDIRSFIPFIRQGTKGMIDTLTGTFYPNANTSGSFTIEYTLPDGTPWTPQPIKPT